RSSRWGTAVRQSWAICHTCCLLSLPPKLLQQRLRLLEVSSVKALGEPPVDGCQQLVGLGTFALLLPQPAQRVFENSSCKPVTARCTTIPPCYGPTLSLLCDCWVPIHPSVCQRPPTRIS